MTIIQVIAMNVRRLRTDRDWTQAELAKRAGVTPTTIVHIETEETWLRPLMVSQIAKALEVPEAELFRGESEHPLPPLNVALQVLNLSIELYMRLDEKLGRDLILLLLDQDEIGLTQISAVARGNLKGRGIPTKPTKLSVQTPKRNTKS